MLDKLHPAEKNSNKFFHDLYNSLIAIQSNADGAADFLPKLVQGYQSAVEANLIENPIRPQHLNILRRVFANIQFSTKEMLKDLNQLENIIKPNK